MESLDSIKNDVNLERDGDSIAEDSSLISTQAPASFKGKLDLSSYGYSRTSTLRSAGKSSTTTKPPTTATIDYDEDEDETQNTTSRKRRVQATAPRRPVKRKKSSGYAPPSTYAHLQPLPDTLQAGLICVFIGLNPGIVRRPTRFTSTFHL
jgi:hypothetical protein